MLQCDIHLHRGIQLIEIKFCEDTRPQNQLSVTQEQHKGLCSILQGASVILHSILLGVGGNIYNNHTLEPVKELGLDSQRVSLSLLPSFMFILSITLPNLSVPYVHFPVLLSPAIRSRFQTKPATLLIPIDSSFPFCGGGAFSFTELGTKVAPFPW